VVAFCGQNLVSATGLSDDCLERESDCERPLVSSQSEILNKEGVLQRSVKRRVCFMRDMLCDAFLNAMMPTRGREDESMLLNDE
jgi:hypothetical protein